MNYKFVKVSKFYPSYLNYFYDNNSNLPVDYNEHLQVLLDDCFAYGDAFSRHLSKLGNNTHEIIYNDKILQKKWANQNNVSYFKDWKNIILSKQLEKIEPDVIFWNMNVGNESIQNIIKNISSVKINFTQIGVSIYDWRKFEPFDFVITCLKYQVEKLKKKNIDAFFIRHGFNKKVLDKIESSTSDIDFSFVGSLHWHHKKRAEYIKFLSEYSPLKTWTNNSVNPNIVDYLKYIIKKSLANIPDIIKALDINRNKLINRIINISTKWDKYNLISFPQQIINKFQKPLYGIDMFQVLQNSKISLNVHVDDAKKFAANIRMYEVTGVGTCLLTERKKDIKEYFTPGYEIVTYKSKEEALEKVKYLLENEKKIEQIAKRGQERTLKEHTLEKRIKKINTIIQRYL